MTKKNFSFRCLSDPSKGFGNFKRCLSIAELLKEKSYNITFFIDKNNSVIDELKKRNMSYFLIKSKISFSDEINFIYKTMIKIKSNYLIIDMREYGESYSKQFSNFDITSILIDDAWCKSVYADIIINGTMIKKYHQYKIKNKNAKIFTGSKYCTIQSEFRKYRKKLSEIHEKTTYDVTISMGGSDPHNISKKVLSAIYKIPNIRICLILGPFYNISNLEFFKILPSIKIIKNSKNIWKIFQNSDLVISSGGTSLFELSVIRTPTIVITSSHHQIAYAKIFSSRGSVLYLGYWSQIKQSQIKASIQNILKNTELRKQMYTKSKILDGKGLERVVNIIEKSI